MWCFASFQSFESSVDRILGTSFVITKKVRRFAFDPRAYIPLNYYDRNYRFGASIFYTMDKTDRIWYLGFDASQRTTWV